MILCPLTISYNVSKNCVFGIFYYSIIKTSLFEALFLVIIAIPMLKKDIKKRLVILHFFFSPCESETLLSASIS